jgi:hypothetical protein
MENDHLWSHTNRYFKKILKIIIQIKLEYENSPKYQNLSPLVIFHQ